MELEEAIEKTKALLNLNDILFEETGTHLYLGKQEKELIQILLNHITKQEKMMDKMIKVMSDRNICKYFIENYCKHYAGENKKTCVVCIKQYFEKKVEEAE